MGRYFENIDLSQMTCVIQYINAAGEGGVYVVPFVDVTTYQDINEMLVPWAVGGRVTKEAGTIRFSIRFYQINQTTKTFDYNLSTLPQECEVLYGFDIPNDADQSEYVDAATLEDLIQRVERAEQGLVLYWKNV